jgi:hypothetical protein
MCGRQGYTCSSRERELQESSLLNAQIAANVNTAGTICDPLGRVNRSPAVF